MGLWSRLRHEHQTPDKGASSSASHRAHTSLVWPPWDDSQYSSPQTEDLQCLIPAPREQMETGHPPELIWRWEMARDGERTEIAPWWSDALQIYWIRRIQVTWSDWKVARCHNSVSDSCCLYRTWDTQQSRVQHSTNSWSEVTLNEATSARNKRQKRTLNIYIYTGLSIYIYTY